MVRWIAVLAVAVLAALPGARAGAQESFMATMLGENQNPPVTTDASGFATFTLSFSEDELAYVVDITGLDWAVGGFGDTLINTPTDPSDDLTGLHIHAGPAGTDGGIVFGMFGPNHDADFQSQVVASDTIRFTGMWDGSDTLADPLASHLANLRSEGLYINAHTNANPSGEIRGQLVAAPEPVPMGLLALGLLALLAARVGAPSSPGPS